ncbi:MAG: acylphosphatase [Arcobacteraceae bacterium]|nr:acylphosphatase [Arcobacteraceae bacterium]
MQSYRFIVIGHVQGVYYRKNIQENATKERFCGYVKNLQDGTVEACVTCDESRLEPFLAILQKGSPNSIVKDIKQFHCDEFFTKDFEIRY